MKTIQSTKNELIKEIKKLHKKKERERTQRFLIEGFHLIEEAWKNECEITQVFFTNRGLNEWGEFFKHFPEEQKTLVSDEVMHTLSELPTPQGICAVVKMKEQKMTEWSGGWLLLDNVQDPGNVGTMIRSADAFGLSGVILGKGTADIYSGKVLRAMQGSNFHLPIVQMELQESIDLLKKHKVTVYGTELNERAISLSEVQKTKNYAIILGNEGTGVSSEILEKTDANIFIEMKGNAESLNVAIAASILMYSFSV
ncbi:RNA methyltransferase, TrmH family [Pilibacter termitis]|uniref:RNA methyltransferase, TrmH family n=1 Tax=Pilibacter termitis TaxID=263852 RepID=A0A1T4QSF9_9ENTE|nr:RNA methyltransferase [Pilibacter termitis]SKA06645.1 RNA methyltransferase, TrmH family [Pilibacter termitis]